MARKYLLSICVPTYAEEVYLEFHKFKTVKQVQKDVIKEHGKVNPIILTPEQAIELSKELLNAAYTGKCISPSVKAALDEDCK